MTAGVIYFRLYGITPTHSLRLQYTFEITHPITKQKKKTNQPSLFPEKGRNFEMKAFLYFLLF